MARPMHFKPAQRHQTASRPSPGWRPRWWVRGAARVAALPTILRVKLISYVFALAAATPGLTLLLIDLLRHGAYPYAAAHGAVMLGAAALFAAVLLRRLQVDVAERFFAQLLTVSATGFLILYATHPETVLDYRLLGNVLLFIVSGLLLILPPRMSIPLSVALLAVYNLEVTILSDVPTRQRQLDQWVNIGLVALLMVGVVVRETLTLMTARLQVLEELAARDALTGLLNRRGFDQQAGPQRTDGQGGSLIVMDIDDFKPINDTHGHVAGDQILKELAALLRQNSPPEALCARWGGEEFVVYLHGSDRQQASQLAETLRWAAQQAELHPPITLSLGVDTWHPGEPLHHAFLRADNAMYSAKAQGKNRVVVTA